MDENYLAKWLNGEFSQEELAAFEQTDEFKTVSQIKDITSRLSPPEFDQDKAWESLMDKRFREQDKVKVLHPFRPFLRVAATIAILITGAYFFINDSATEVETQLAQQMEYTLPDASEVKLNAGSTLVFDEKNWQNERRLKLEGEAYFKVAKGKKFSVETPIGEVWVLGTQFNVKQRDEFLEVVCFEGLVRVVHKEMAYELPAGNAIRIWKNDVEHMEGLTATAPSWLDNESSFTKTPLFMVFEELERQFDIEVSSEGINKNQLFTGSFSNTNLVSALKSISTPTQIEYERSNGKVLFYGTEKNP